MGLPNDVADRPTFKWDTVRTYANSANVDASGNPWNFSTTPTTSTTHADVQVDCAVEFIPRVTLAGGTPIGHFDTPRAIITVLDEDYTLIEGATSVTLGQNEYVIDYIAPPLGMFSVTVYQIHCSAKDEA